LKSGKPSPSLNISTVSESKWKTFDSKPILFSTDKDLAHVRLVCESLLERLAYLEGFFSKKASSMLLPLDPKRELVLELRKPPAGKPPLLRTLHGCLPLKIATVDELLKIGFIKPSMDKNVASVLFAPKPHSEEGRFCIDYQWISQFLVSHQVLAPDVNGTIANCRNDKRMIKIDIIRTRSTSY
jgi:hypothetical protein